jgi:hypothetical protein
MANGFTDKEILLEIKLDLKDFREQYTEDSEDRHREMAKRPTRGELWSLVAGASALFAVALAFVG